MQFSEFQAQMERLGRNYPGNTYSTDRMDILWAECHGFSSQRFTDLVTELIGTFTRPPMLKEFREMAAKVRERISYDEQQQLKRDSEKFLKNEDVQELFDLLRKRLNGQMSHEDFQGHMKTLDRTVELGMRGKEKPCCTDGMIGARHRTTKNLFSFRCNCQRGNQYQAIPPWRENLSVHYEVVG